MIVEQSKAILAEVSKAFIGKNEIVKKVLMTIYAGGHILLEDCPGVGKTTLAVAFSKTLGLSSKRIQFTPDTLPSDITGFTVFNRETNHFEYRDGAANCQLLLADEINRTSPKTQSALLEVMEEHTVTVDGETHVLPSPFICIATQNPVGSAGTQSLPESQLDRFMICLSIGYPSLENQMRIINAQRYSNPLSDVRPVTIVPSGSSKAAAGCPVASARFNAASTTGRFSGSNFSWRIRFSIFCNSASEARPWRTRHAVLK